MAKMTLAVFVTLLLTLNAQADVAFRSDGYIPLKVTERVAQKVKRECFRMARTERLSFKGEKTNIGALHEYTFTSKGRSNGLGDPEWDITVKVEFDPFEFRTFITDFVSNGDCR